MVHEIFIVEDTEDLINNLKPEFKGDKDIILKHITSRHSCWPFTWYTCTYTY